VNLISTKEQATKIAFNIREKGRGKSNPGRLKKVQGIGWYLEERKISQVSTNIQDTDVTKLHQVFEEVVSDAKMYNLPVVGSEVVGMVPLQVLLDAADFYIQRDNLMILEEESKIGLVRSILGLDFLKQFDPKTRIIEYAIKDDKLTSPISSLPVSCFIKEIAKRSEAPGGGSVSAATAAMGTALGCMVGQLSYGKKKWEDVEEVMRKNLPIIYDVTMKLITLIDRDTEAFNAFFKALKMPQGTKEEKQLKAAAKEKGILFAISCPKNTMKIGNSAWEALKEIAIHGNINCVSDIQVGAKCIHTGVWGAYQNIQINLSEVEDEKLRTEIAEEAEKDLQIAESCLKEILEIANNRIKA